MYEFYKPKFYKIKKLYNDRQFKSAEENKCTYYEMEVNVK